ncbi:tetratricopeptide repeat protein [Streptomyces sp. AN091965]|uniref:tetratricopeptide repeat protein n=1 Tax=Streptomyces sp. AN091965 TaxID=2927803 RepID=UPI001F62214F|nr:tetratricopeptide repeat protein [Streptomyces sp. AN091965]MCI3932041.1 tetratricopeptide repeat protein [Streptomyces sp. AN091965]
MDVRRVVELWNPDAGLSGTGYLVADRLVLTALHTVRGAGEVEVRLLGGDAWARAEVLWPVEEAGAPDAALVRLVGGCWAPPGGEPVRWGRVDGAAPPTEGRLSCLAVGFPRSEVRDGVRDTKEVRGHVETLTGLKANGVITVYVDGVAAPSRGEGRWAGASGAALFAQGRLIGVLATDRARDYEANQLTAVSVESLAARPGFARAVGDLVLESLTTEPSRAWTAYDVEAPPGLNNLPELPSRHFVGRADVLAELERALAADSQTITQTLHGLGGVGKTTLALHYAHAHVGSYRLVWWIRSDSRELIEASLAALALRIQGAAASDLTTTQAADWAVGWLQTHPGWLLVFDNVERPEDAATVTGQLRSSGRYLITSRYRSGWPGAPIALPVLDEGASLDLLARLTDDGDAEAEARALAEELGHLPLALEQAGAFVAQTGSTLGEYRLMLRRYPERTTAAAPGGADPTRTVARIWRITLDAVHARDPRAVDLLCTAAWYAPTEIPRELFTELAEDELDLAQLLGLLADYNLIVLGRGTLGVHRLVQRVARTVSPEDPHRTPERITRARDGAAAALRRVLPFDPRLNVAGWPGWRRLLPHVEALLDAVDPADDTEDTDFALNEWAQYLAGQGQRGRAIALLHRSVDASSRLFGEKHTSTLTAYNNLASAYEAAGDLDEAIALLERTLTARIEVSGDDDPHTLIVRNNLASAYQSAGDLERATPLHERNLSDRMRLLGSDHLSTLLSRNNLADAYLLSGQLARAAPMFEETLDDCVRVLGGDHPFTHVVRSNVAYCCEAAGDLERAVALLEQTVADRARTLGGEHPDALRSQLHLARVHQAAGDPSRAITLLERTLDVCVRALGDGHGLTGSVRSSLSEALEQTGPPSTNPAVR